MNGRRPDAGSTLTRRERRSEASDRPRWLRNTVLFLGGQTVSLLGSMLVQYAVFWYLTIEYKSGSIMALAAIFGFLPQALVSVFGGVWADRHNRKLLIIGADAAIAVSTLALALVMMTGLRRRVAHLPHDGDPLGGRGHPDARRARRSSPRSCRPGI